MYVQATLFHSTVLTHARHARSTLCPADAKHALHAHGLSSCAGFDMEQRTLRRMGPFERVRAVVLRA
jgi:hypothetical protein